MAQATAQTTCRTAPTEGRYAITETQNIKLGTLRNAVSGLAALSHDGDRETARLTLEVTREDMAAIFEVLADQLEELTGNLPFIGRAAN